MSNPGVLLLDEGKVNNKTIRIEDNLGESIHIHIDDIRLSLTVKEFYQLCNSIDDSAKELLAIEGLDWSKIDKSSLDWEWISEYEKIDSLVKKNIKLNELYTVRPVTQDRNVLRIVKLKDSLLVMELSGKKSKIDNYREKNMYGSSSKERLLGIKKNIENYGYPYDKKLIMIDDNNRIFDGDHRAACLYFLYGGDYEIPVLQIRMKGTKSIKSIIKANKIKLTKYYIKKILKCATTFPKRAANRLFLDDKSIVKSFVPALSSNNTKHYSFNEVIRFLVNNNINYYLINKKVINDGVEIEKTIIVSDINRLNELYKCFYSGVYGSYNFLYSTNPPIELNTEIGKILIFDCLCCKSRFENAILPLDKKINEYMWNECSLMSDENALKSIPEMIYLIANCVLEKCSFDLDDKNYIQSHISLLDENVFKALLETVFFRYSDNVIKALKATEYSNLIDDYIRNVDY